jgi:hypothetical protein
MDAKSELPVPHVTQPSSTDWKTTLSLRLRTSAAKDSP